jgi:hypothetical protein
MNRLRLRHVLVQPVFSLEDGEGNLTDLEHAVVQIPASEWSSYSSERFPREVAEWQAQLDASLDVQSEPPSTSSRAARRARRT